ncbi:MAG: MFS transporter [Deltaproteobacteria bacterium]|jgi:MFS family permease|nr:MFS transporter [Deltaproteobacteria bacterium]
MCLVVHAAWGISTTLTFWAAMLRATNDMAPKAEVGRFYGLLESGRGVLTIIGINICALVFASYEDPNRGMSVVLNIMNGACLFGVFLTWFCFKDPVKLTPSPSLTKDIIEVIKSPWIWCVALIVFSCYSAMVFGGYLTPYMTSVVGISAATVTSLSGFWIYGSQFLAPPISGIISDKISSRPKVLVVLFIYLTAVLVLVIFVPASPAIWLVMVLISASIYIGIYAIRGIYFAILEDLKVPPNIIGAAIGFASLIGFAPDAFVYTLAGKILDNNSGASGYIICFTIAAALSVIGGLASILVLKRAKDIKRMSQQ